VLPLVLYLLYLFRGLRGLKEIAIRTRTALEWFRHGNIKSVVKA
jgi:hypothetical protein